MLKHQLTEEGVDLRGRQSGVDRCWRGVRVGVWGSPRSLRGLTDVSLMNIRLNGGEEASRGRPHYPSAPAPSHHSLFIPVIPQLHRGTLTLVGVWEVVGVGGETVAVTPPTVCLQQDEAAA